MTVSRQGWAYEIVSGGERVDGLALYEVRFWVSLKRQQDGLGSHVIDGVRCDLVNNFKMQIRTNHQHIVTLPGTLQEPEGFMVHASGLLVPTRLVGDEVELKSFLKTNGDPARSGYPAFIFPTYAGVDEELSNEWKHETYILPLLGQAETNIENYIDVAIREGWEGDKRGTTINLQVGAGSDDANETDANLNYSADSSVLFGNSHTSQFGRWNFGIRFTAVTVGQGDTIDAAVYQGYVTDTSYHDPNIDIFANDVDTSADFTDEADVTNRALTAASVQWTATSVGTGFVTSPEIKAVIQEVVDRGSWASSNALMVLPRGKEDAAFTYRIRSYDFDSAEAAKLDITYTAGGGVAHTGVVTMSGASTASFKATYGASAKIAMAGAGSMTAKGAHGMSAAVAIASAGSMSALGTRGALGKVAIAGASTAAFAPGLTHGGKAAMAGNAAAQFAASYGAGGKVAIAGAGSAQFVGALGAGGKTTMSGAGSMSAIGGIVHGGVVSMASAGSMSALATVFKTGVVAFDGLSTMTAAGTKAVTGVVAMAGNAVAQFAGRLGHGGKTAMSSEGSAQFAATHTPGAPVVSDPDRGIRKWLR